MQSTGSGQRLVPYLPNRAYSELVILASQEGSLSASCTLLFQVLFFRVREKHHRRVRVHVGEEINKYSSESSQFRSN